MIRFKILIILIFCTLFYFNFSYSLQKSIPDTSSSDISSGEKDYRFIELIEEGYLFLEHKLYDDAIKKFNEANKIKETSNAYKGLGLAYIEKAKELEQMMATPYRSLRKVSFFESSVENFLKGLKIEPDNLEIRYSLAEAFIFRGYPETYALADTLLNQIIQTDKGYKDALILLSIVHRNLNRPEESKEALDEYMKEKEGNPRALYHLSKIEMEEDNFEEAERYFIASLDNLNEEDAIAEILEDVGMLFSDKDQEEYQQAEDKGKFFKRFWMEKDPEPETKVNERLVEHFKRVKHAKEYFTTGSFYERYDDRGRIYIKYGEPDAKYMDGGGISVYSNESWVYYWQIGDYRDGMFFDFANKGGKGYELIEDLREATYGGGLDDLIVTSLNLYSERSNLSENHYGRVARVRSEMDYLTQMSDFHERIEIMNNNIPGEGFVYHTDSKALNTLVSSASFRGENDKTRYELYYSFPLEELEFEKKEKNKISAFDELVILKDLDNNTILQGSRNFDLTYDEDKNLKKDLYIGQINMEILPEKDDCIAYLKLKSDVSEKLGVLYQELETKDYTGESLMMSDIEFSYDIRPAAAENEFTKNGLQIIPHTGAVLNKNENIFVYFEIYNLALDSDGNGRYRVEYVIQKRSPDDEGKSKYFNSIGKEIVNTRVREKEMITTSRTETTEQKDTFNWISFDMSGLSEGLYDFTIKITNLVSSESTSSEYIFILGKD